MKVLLIVNAAASSVTPRRQVGVHRLASAAHDVRMVETRHRGHATEFAQTAGRLALLGVLGLLPVLWRARRQ